MISFKDYDYAYPGSISVSLVIKKNAHRLWAIRRIRDQRSTNLRQIPYILPKKHLASFVNKKPWQEPCRFLSKEGQKSGISAMGFGFFWSSLDSMSCCGHVASWLWNLCTTWEVSKKLRTVNPWKTTPTHVWELVSCNLSVRFEPKKTHTTQIHRRNPPTEHVWTKNLWLKICKKKSGDHWVLRPPSHIWFDVPRLECVRCVLVHANVNMDIAG